MAGKFIELNDAARMLGLSADELNDLRMKGEISAVRDGTSWKFKSDELERVAEDRGISLPGAEPGTDVLVASELQEEDNDSAVLDVSELDEDDLDSAPTAIGDLPGGEDSDLDLGLVDAADADIDPSAKTGVRGAAEDDDLGLELEPASADSSSDVALIPDDTGSEVNLVADSGPDILGGTDVGLEGAAGSGELEFEGSDLSLGSDISVSEDEEISLGDDEEDLTIGDDEEISLEDDDELVLESGSDITGGTGDTGINLGSPSDSGLNLEEEPLDLAGSSVSSLELPEDDDLIDLEDLDGGEAAVQADEDFQLAPSADQFEDEEDSGSQVIALEDSEAFEAAAEEGALAAEPVLGEVEEGGELEAALEEPDAASVTQPALPESAMIAAAPEVPYSIWNVLSLLGIIIVLSVTGMLMTDLVRNMWTWNDPYTASTPIMDMAVNMFGLDP
jgi:hypothetical protein